MLCFVMALKSRKLAKDWVRTSQLCEAAVRSALGQTDPDVRVIVVCHEPPDWRLPPDPRLEVLPVDFPPPPPDPRLTMRDKWRKVATALARAGQMKPAFVMVMDADDLVSNRLAAHTKAHPGANGWTFRTGYQYRWGARWLKLVDDLRTQCGTSAIVSARLIKFPHDGESEDSRKDCVLLRWGHTVIAQELAKAGTPLDELPFSGAVYTLAHGENDSDLTVGTRRWRWLSRARRFVTEFRRQRYLTRSRRHEFALDRGTGD